MKIIRNNLLPFIKFTVVNLFGYVFTKEKYLSDKIINHQEIHTEQMKELYYVPFYIIYFFEWLYESFKLKSFKEGRKEISFEKEANEHDTDPFYLNNRKPFAWFHYWYEYWG